MLSRNWTLFVAISVIAVSLAALTGCQRPRFVEYKTLPDGTEIPTGRTIPQTPTTTPFASGNELPTGDPVAVTILLLKEGSNDLRQIPASYYLNWNIVAFSKAEYRFYEQAELKKYAAEDGFGILVYGYPHTLYLGFIFEDKWSSKGNFRLWQLLGDISERVEPRKGESNHNALVRTHRERVTEHPKKASETQKASSADVPLPKVLDTLEAMRNNGFTEVNKDSAVWITADPNAAAMWPNIQSLEKYWGTTLVVISSHPEQEWNGKQYYEFVISKYPITQ